MMSLDQLAPIQYLSQDVKNQLRSGIATPSVVQCVEELVVNSIDAGASCIAVRVDLPDCKVQVVDNGRGITKDDMLYVGERYATSKCHDTKDLENISHYGYRGEALASIKEISSVLEISSRARGSEVTYSKLYRHGKDQGISKHSKVRPSGGTTVAAHNVFYNLPVRRKVLCSPLVYEQICKRLQAISLIHPQISLTLRNDSTGVKSIQTHNSSSIVQTFGYLFGKDVADCLKEVNHIRTIFNVSGFIGSTSFRNKSLQFVYVNGRLVLKTKIHKLINELLSNSLVTKSKGKNQDTALGYTMKSNAASSTCQPSPGGNQVEYGIFVLNITCPRSEYDITLDPSKTLIEFRDWEGAVTCVHELVTSFLHREHLTMKLTVTQKGSEAGLQERDSLSSDNMESKETDVCVNAISTTDCTNAVQSTCVRRQTIPVPHVSPMVDDQNPCDVETIADSNGEGDGACTDVSLNNPDKTPDAFGDATERMDEPDIIQSDASETIIPQCELNTHADSEKIIPTSASNHTDPVVDAHCQPCGGILATKPVPTTPDIEKKASDSPLKMQSVTAEALLTSSSSELDVCSSEETLTSSEVEIRTPESDVHQCCDARCRSLRRDDTDSGLKVADLLSPRTKLAVKARNSLSMFRRSVKKKRLTKAGKDESSKKSEQKVNKHLQFVTASEHKTIALRWHRSPGFRSRLENLNIKCQDRQEQRMNPMMDVLQRLSSSSGPNQPNNDMGASSSPSSSSRKEVCQNHQHTSTDENSKPDHHKKCLHVAEILENNADQHFSDKHNVSTVSVDEKEGNPAEHKEHLVQDSEGQITIDAGRDKCTEVTTGEYCVRGRISGNAPCIPTSSMLESTHTKKRVADYPNCLIIAEEQKKVVPCANSTSQSSTLNSSASAEMPRKFLTSTSFMVSACEVFDREPSQTSSQTDGCTKINNAELKQAVNQSAREADDAHVMTQPNQQRPVAVPPCNATEPFSVHDEYEFAEGAEGLYRNNIDDQTLDDGTSCPSMEGDITLIVAPGIQLMNEEDTVVDDDQGAIKSLLLDVNENELKGSIVDLTTEPDTVSENMDLLDTIDADESISLLYIPHQDEGLCNNTKSYQESISLSEQPGKERVISTDIQCTEMSTALVASSLSPSVTHQNNDDLDVTGDLDVTSTHVRHCVGDDEVEISSHDNLSSQSSKVCESFHPTENEVMDATIPSAGNTDGEFVIENREWYSVYDVSRGMKVFINRFNGNCSMEKPEEGPGMNQEARQISEDTQFSMVTKSDTLAHPHLPHSAAPFVTSLRDKKESSHSRDPPVTHATMATIDAAMEESQEEDDELSMVKWGNSSQISGKGCATDEAPHFLKSDQAETGCRFLTSNVSEGLSSVDAKFQAMVLSSLNPCQFTKAMFNSIKVLGQVDTKFIACLVNSDYDKNPAGESNLLILVDQHAAHERIRLEMLIQDAYTPRVDTDDIDNDKTRCIRTSEVTPALRIGLSPSELRLLEAYSPKMKRIGIEYTLSGDSAMVTHLPACFVEKEANELKRGRQTIATSMAETLIKEVLDSIQHQSGAVSSLPKTITRILNSQACHGAIKFGDTLDRDECKTLIGQLSSCDLPFQCAHGRPALMPIFDFKKIKHGVSEKVTPQVWKLKYLSSGTTTQA
eukprot:XP_780519.3 PREDICTED: DNA mismatch repair protein Mlh3 [Strongylocentrotus purpuratus]